MKTNTSKLYSKMTSAEKARLYHRTVDLEECRKLRASVPKIAYSCLDADFADKITYLNYATAWAEIEYWRTTSFLNEQLHEAHMHSTLGICGDVDKRLSNVYVSKLKALELALVHHNLEYVLDRSEVSVNADGLAMVYELELNAEYVETFKTNAISFMGEILDSD